MENQISSIKKTSQFKEVTRRLFKNKLAIAGLVFIVLLIFIMIFADFLAPYGYAEQDFTATYQGPSAEHLLGTDHLGRDILSRLIYGSRISMEIAVLSVALSATIGITIGAIAGFYGGKIDNLLMRFLDIYQSIPVLILSIAIATSLGPGVTNTILALAISVCPSYARLMRASVMTVRDKEYIEAARSINANDARIILCHALPNAFSPMIVNITMTIGSSMLTAATLSFVGLGAQPPSPEWGAMLTAAKSYIRDYPYMITSPGVCIMLSVLSFNVLGDGLRDALDPRLKN
jgi:peptide/nickel transport system permease protein